MNQWKVEVIALAVGGASPVASAGHLAVRAGLVRARVPGP